MHKSATRRYARYRTEIPVIVKVLGTDGYLRIHGRCFEIASAGLGAVITSELTAGEMVTLESPFLTFLRFSSCDRWFGIAWVFCTALNSLARFPIRVN